MPRQPAATPATSDDFTGKNLGLQWQWQANHGDDWSSLADRPGFLRLHAGIGDATNLFRYTRFLGQKFPAGKFAVRTSVDVSGAAPGSWAGLAIIGGDKSHFVGVRRHPDGADYVLGTPDGLAMLGPCPAMKADCAVRVEPDGTFRFTAPEVSPVFSASPGGWIGAKVGLFHLAEHPASESHVDFSPFLFSA